MKPDQQNVTYGSTILLSNSGTGWDPPALLLPSPLVLLTFEKGITRLLHAQTLEAFYVGERDPLELLESILSDIKKHVPVAGPGAGKPSFPLAAVASSYEFGRHFSPHQSAFTHHQEMKHSEFFAAVYIDAYRPDLQGNTERIGYAGVIPEGWMENGPRLENTPWGHDAPPVFPHPVEAKSEVEEIKPLVAFDEYSLMIQRVKDYLAAGDIYQANLTVPFQGKTNAPPEAIFDMAIKRGGAAFGAMMLTMEGTLLSFSPELYIRRRGRSIETRPIKGTRSLPQHLEGRTAAIESLKSSEKDKSEHVMIVDLERNDLGRLCEYGSVKAKPFMRPTEHPTLIHLESTVKGTLKSGVTIRDIFEATYPGGSVTGAPKKRSMEIISEIERYPRGFYCGAVGWVDCEGDCDLNLPIRTGFIDKEGHVHFHSGGGIVADSQASEEWDELLLKASFFQEVLREVESNLPS